MKTDIYVSSLIWNSITYIITGKKFQQDLENSCSISIEKALEGRVGMQDEILEQMEKQQDLKDRCWGWSFLRDHEKITPRKPGLCSQFRKWMGVKGQDTRAKGIFTVDFNLDTDLIFWKLIWNPTSILFRLNLDA